LDESIGDTFVLTGSERSADRMADKSTYTKVWAIPSSDCFVLTILTQSELSKARASRILEEEQTMAQQATGLASQKGEGARSAVERIAAFAAAARPEQLTPNVRRLLKRNILDSLGCAIAALPGRPFQALREQFEEYRAPGRCTLIGGGKTSADQAALFNSGLTRYVDLLDSYVSPGGSPIRVEAHRKGKLNSGESGRIDFHGSAPSAGNA
jgi:hypothetical protein